MLGPLWGLLAGVVIGGAIAALSIKVLGLLVVGGWTAYALAMLAGVLVGLVAGKPIWAEGARIEAGLKAGFGAALAAALMYALQRWVHVDVDVTKFGLGAGPLSQNPALAFPAVAAALALLFEVDNLFGGDDNAGKPKKRIAASSESSKASLPEEESEPAEVEKRGDGASKQRR
jgi:hypothetical protein